MAVVISEIVTEVVLSGTPPAPAGPQGAVPDEDELVERVVRRATERVLERLRREWET